MTKPANRPHLFPDGIPFTQFPNDAITDPNVTPAALRVLMYLFMRANGAWRTWPSQRTVAKHLSMSRNTVGTALAMLEAEGWITITLAGKDPDAPVEHKQKHSYVVHGTRPDRLFDPKPGQEVNRRDNSAGAIVDATGANPEPEPAQEPRHNNKQIQQTEQYPTLSSTNSTPKQRNSGWDFITDTDNFNLATGTKPQQLRVGRLAADINSTLDNSQIPDHDRPDVLARAAQAWPSHFSDATLTPDAYAKHLAALMRPPLRGNQQATKQANRAADDAELIARMG